MFPDAEGKLSLEGSLPLIDSSSDIKGRGHFSNNQILACVLHQKHQFGKKGGSCAFGAFQVSYNTVISSHALFFFIFVPEYWDRC